MEILKFAGEMRGDRAKPADLKVSIEMICSLKHTYAQISYY